MYPVTFLDTRLEMFVHIYSSKIIYLPQMEIVRKCYYKHIDHIKHAALPFACGQGYDR
jgi:hypothetical protein